MKQIILSLFIVLVFTACSGKTNFMGADKYIGGGNFVERWYVKSGYKQSIPKGTKFYGSSAEKIKNKFNIKYYQKTKDGKDNILMPKKDLWIIKHNGKEFYDQDNEKLFYYIKVGEKFIKKLNSNGTISRAIYVDTKLLAVKECFSNGMCKLYPDVYESKDIYIYKSILDKPLFKVRN